MQQCFSWIVRLPYVAIQQYNFCIELNTLELNTSHDLSSKTQAVKTAMSQAYKTGSIYFKTDILDWSYVTS